MSAAAGTGSEPSATSSPAATRPPKAAARARGAPQRTSTTIFEQGSFRRQRRPRTRSVPEAWSLATRTANVGPVTRPALPSPRLQALLLASALGLLAAIAAAFLLAPVEARMGIVQKIFYFHVPAAYACYLSFLVSAVGGAGYLWKRTDRWDALVVAGAEVGLLFWIVVLVTGPLWARKAWGVWWTWDPRLTTMLLAGLVFLAVVVLRGSEPANEVEKRFAAGLAVFGVIDLPLVHYSVQRWRGQHPTVITGRGGGLHPDMTKALLVSLLAFTLLAALLLTLRFRLQRVTLRLAGLRTEASLRGLDEEDEEGAIEEGQP